MIRVLVNNEEYKDFLNVSLTTSIETLSNDFSFSATAVNLFPPFRVKDNVVIEVNGVKKLTGIIEDISGGESEGSHTISYSGRDRTGDLVDSSVCDFDDMRSETSLQKIIEKILSNIGSDLLVVDEVEPELFNLAEDIIEANDGNNAFDLALSYARKRQCLLTSDKDGDVVITQSQPDDSGLVLKRLALGENNIISQNFEVSSSGLFNRYIHKGQIEPRAQNNYPGNKVKSSVQVGISIDSSVRNGRQFVQVEDHSYASAQLKDRALWSRQMARAQAMRFSCSIAGHHLYNENTLALVQSDIADIDRDMLIDSITYSEGEGQPSLTSFELVEKDVYTIDDKILAQKPVGKQNEAFV